MENGGTAKKSCATTLYLAHPHPSWTPDGRKFGSSPGAFGSGQNAHSAAK